MGRRKWEELSLGEEKRRGEELHRTEGKGEELGGIDGEAAEREARGLEKPQVLWDNIDGNRVV